MRSGYYHSEAGLFLGSLPARSVNVTITSPPYGAMKDYGTKNQIGFGQSFAEYLDALLGIFGLLLEKTTDDGSLWIVADTFRERSELRLFPFELAARLGKVGWKMQDVIIWNKAKTLPWSRRGQFRKTFEYILFFTKNRNFKYFVSRIKEPDNLKEWWVRYPERYSPEGKVPTAIWNFPIPVQGSWSKVQFRHFCPFPAALVERIVLLTTDPGDLVLDPFAGSGVVLAQGRAMGRKFLGCDVNKIYRDQFYRIISGHIKEKWTRGRRLLKETNVTRKHLAQQIRKLRQVKFPKALFKEIRRALGVSQVSGIKAILSKSVSLNGSSSPDCFAKMFIYFLCEKGTPIADIERQARNCAGKAPLSKYGIAAEVHAHLAENFWKSRDGRLLGGQSLFLYKEGITHEAQRKVIGSDTFSVPLSSWKRVPPIVSNVEVHQELIRTWGQTQGEDQ
jgi:DNA modification methylase